MIDVNASLGHWPFWQLKHNTPTGLLKLMDSMGIRSAVVAPFEGLLYKDVQVANRRLHREISRYRRRLLPFSVINPKFPDWRRDLNQCTKELKTGGIRLFPSYHGYEISDSCCKELLAELQQRDLPVQIAPVIEDPRMHHPRVAVPAANIEALPQLVKEFPKVRIAVLNTKTFQFMPGNIPSRNTKVLREADNFFTDIAWTDGFAGVDELIKLVGLKGVIFGTNAPLLLPLSAVYKLKEATLSKAALNAITNKNALKFLGSSGKIFKTSAAHK